MNPTPMPQSTVYPIRKECPPGACDCGRDDLMIKPDGDTRILRLTREEEKKLIEHIENMATYADLKKMQERLFAQLGVTLHIAPGLREVRTLRGLTIELAAQPGLCKKTRAAIPAAVRRCLGAHPDIAYAILDTNDLFGTQ